MLDTCSFNICSTYRVVFKFKGSKKSNNGTDVNAGQIPQLLYRYVNGLLSSTQLFFVSLLIISSLS